MIRITTHSVQGCTVVTIVGRMVNGDVTELQRVRDGLPGEVVLNLGDLTECSGEGLRMLRTWLAAGARLGDATPYLRMVLGTTMDRGRQ